MQFSIIIPTRNRPHQLARCLHSLAALAFAAGEWELIVVNDGGDASFAEVSDELKAALPLQLITIAQAGPAAARNAGAAAAAGDLLAFTDDDCRVAPDWLAQMAAGFAATGCDVLAGQTCNPHPNRSGMVASQFLLDFLYKQQRDENGRLHLIISNNAAIRREAFVAVGGFDTTFPLAAAEDMDLSLRLVQAGCKLAFYAPAQVWHHHQLTAWGHVRQQFRYGRGGHYFLQKKATFTVTRQVANDKFNADLLAALRRSSLPLFTRLLVLLGQVGYRLGILWERLRH